MKQHSIMCVLAVLASQLLGVDASADTLIVSKWGPPVYRVLQEALDAAAPGDTIRIEGGTFSETTTRFVDGKNREAVGWIDKPLTIIGTELAWLDGPPERKDHVLHTFDDCHFEGLQVKGSLGAGIFLRGGRSSIRECHFEDLGDGVFCGNPGSAVSIANCEFYRCEYACVAVMIQASGTIDDCYFEARPDPGSLSKATYLAYDSELIVRNSSFTGYGIVEVFGPGKATVSDCEMRELRISAFLAWNGGVIQVDRCSAAGGDTIPGPIGMEVSSGGGIVADSCVFNDMSCGAYGRGAGSIELHNSQITNWRDHSVLLSSFNSDPFTVFDFTNNWWGTTDSTAIAEGIFDGNDDPIYNSHGYVEFWPIRDTPLTAKRSSFGSLKSHF